MKESKDSLLGLVRDGKAITGRQQLKLALLLAVPAILAQFSSVLLQYIDASMVGHLGANPSASIGLVSTSTWICNGFAMAVMQGFSVQVAHMCGGKDFESARSIMCKGLTSVFIFTLGLALIAACISGYLPHWLGGAPEICHDASRYFLIYSLFLPIVVLGFTSGSMLQASGNMKVPSMMFVAMGVMDVVFNYLFIYILDMGVVGAALGTGVSETLTTSFGLWYLFNRSDELKARKGERPGFIPDGKVLKNAFGITGPMWLQNVIMRGAYVVSTLIVAPLGAVSIAANSFAIIAESFCYMPGQGLSDASTTLVGQSLGAGRKDVAKRFAKITVSLASMLMTCLAVLMFILAPVIMGLLSSDPDVVALGAKVLRIEAFAETLYAVSIAGYGSCVGGGDTLVPSAMNFCSMWLVRIGLSLILTPKLGLTGYWIAMCIELNIRGILFIWRLSSDRWMKLKLTNK